MPLVVEKNKISVFRVCCIVAYWLTCGQTLAQTDSISLNLQFQNERIIHVRQRFNVADRTQGKSPFYLYTWINAYKNKSALSHTKLTERNDRLYFARKESLGAIMNLKILSQGTAEYLSVKNEEYIPVNIKASPSGRFVFTAEYDLKLPSDNFTGYGYNTTTGDMYLKYFFLHPGVYKEGIFIVQKFKDFESLSSNNTDYKVEVQRRTDKSKIYTDLEQISPTEYRGDNRAFFDIALLNSEQITRFNINGTALVFQEKINAEDSLALTKILERQINFLNTYFPKINEPLIISRKLIDSYKLKAIEDLKIPIINKKYKIFEPEDRLDLHYLFPLFSAYCERNILVNKRKGHWILNGIKMYLLLKYLESYHQNTAILGNVAEDIRLFSIHPLKWFEESRLRFIDRYPIYYRYFMKQNIDQPIATPFDELSPENQIQVSGVKTALALDYLECYLPEGEFKRILKKLINKNTGHSISTTEFRDFFQKHASKNIDWFFSEVLKTYGNLDIAIHKVEKEGDSVTVTIKNKNLFKGPVEVDFYKDSILLHKQWVPLFKRKTIFKTNALDYDKVQISRGRYFSDANGYNNIYRPNKWVKTRLKLAPIGGIPFNEFYRIFAAPDIRWNNYDKLQLGIRLTNETFFPQDFTFKLTPSYSFGPGKVLARTSMIYRWRPKSNLFRQINLLANTGIGHYQRGLEYFKYGAGIRFNFKKPVRSLKNHFLELSFDNIQRDLPPSPSPSEVELQRYQLLNAKYEYRNLSTIHEVFSFINYQYSNKFSKLYGEVYHKWKISKHKRIGIRLFSGAFFRYDLAETDFYDFGLDRISDYSYYHGLLGRSEFSGILSQQFVMAEGGFKSRLNAKANEFMLTLNLEYPLTPMLDVYADFGTYKNQLTRLKSAYDTGIRVNIVPDFVELYFPIQSSLGFEVTKPKYYERIRFLLNLNLGRIREYWRLRKLQL